MRSMEGLVLAFDRERSFLKNILRAEVRRFRGEECCREGGARLRFMSVGIDFNYRCEVE